jgi:hypothetical protein
MIHLLAWLLSPFAMGLILLGNLVAWWDRR